MTEPLLPPFKPADLADVEAGAREQYEAMMHGREVANTLAEASGFSPLVEATLGLDRVAACNALIALIYETKRLSLSPDELDAWFMRGYRAQPD